MQYTARYASPLGEILLAADEQGLTGLWFQGQARFAAGLEAGAREGPSPYLDDAQSWLDAYFAGEEPPERPPLHLSGSPLQRQVWALLQQIPRGRTTTYGALAKQIAQARGLARFSAQAVGQAVGRNPVSILVPCHRVLGANGSLTGYAGGLERKRALLRLEGALP